MRPLQAPLVLRPGAQRGSVSVELALVSMLLVGILFAGLELGRAMETYNEVCQSTRAAARYLATVPTVGNTERSTAKNLVIYGQFTTGKAIAPELLAGSTKIYVCSPTLCDMPNKTTASMNDVAIAGASSTDLVAVQVTDLTFASNVPAFVSNILFRPITVYLPKVN